MSVEHLSWYRFRCDHCPAVTRPVCGTEVTEAAEQFTDGHDAWLIETTAHESSITGMHIVVGPHTTVDQVACPTCRPPAGEADS